MNPLQQIADNLAALNSDAPEVADAVIKLTNMAAALPAVPDCVLVLMNHIENTLPDEAFNLIDHTVWNAVTNLHLAAVTTPATPALPAVPEVESVTLTVAQIADLANFAGLILAKSPQPAPDELETEITVCTCPEKGVLLDGEDADPGAVAHYKHIAYYSEYPDEGCIGLGAELAATPAHDQPEGEG